MTIRIFEELDAIPSEPMLEFGQSGTDHPPECWHCKQRTPTIGWHVDPETGGYTCDPN